MSSVFKDYDRGIYWRFMLASKVFISPIQMMFTSIFFNISIILNLILHIRIKLSIFRF